jgi:hypothetical protein
MAKPRYSVAIAAAVLALAGCGPQSSEESKQDVLTYPFEARQTEFTDADLLYVAYTPGYTGPEGMYDDAYSPLYYENTVSIGEQDYGWRELCTDDYNQAKAWVDSNTDSSQNLGERQEAKFFEFLRYHGNPAPTYFRVHRCAYMNVYQYDFFNRTPDRGTFNHRPLTPEAVEELGEYLWYLRWHGIGGFKVLSSFADESPDALQHTLYYATFGGGDWGLCDSIGLVRRITTVNRTTGAIVETDQPIRAVEGQCH